MVFESLAATFEQMPGVTLGGGKRGFGSDALQYQGRIFAMSRGRGLVLKLPSERVAELIQAGRGAPFDAGKGRPMRQWVVVTSGSDSELRSLAREALQFAVHRPAR